MPFLLSSRNWLTEKKIFKDGKVENLEENLLLDHSPCYHFICGTIMLWHFEWMGWYYRVIKSWRYYWKHSRALDDVLQERTRNFRSKFIHLLNKLDNHTTGCRRHWRCGFRRFLDSVLLEVCVFLEITIFRRVARDFQTGLDEQSASCNYILQRWERRIGALAVRRYRHERCTVGFVVFLEFAILDIRRCVVAKSILALGFKNKRGRIDSLRRSHLRRGKRTFENSQRRLD